MASEPTHASSPLHPAPSQSTLLRTQLRNLEAQVAALRHELTHSRSARSRSQAPQAEVRSHGNLRPLSPATHAPVDPAGETHSVAASSTGPTRHTFRHRSQSRHVSHPYQRPENPVTNPPVSGVPVQPPESKTFLQTIKGIRPPSFAGKTDQGNEAEVWIEGMEKYFILNSFTECEKTRLGTYLLQDNAALWWKHCKEAHQLQEQTCPWEDFKARFMEEYLSEHYLKNKEMEFLSLAQGKDSVEEYTQKFRRLSHYVPYMAKDEARLTKYILGLAPHLQDRVKTLEPKTLSEAIRKA